MQNQISVENIFDNLSKTAPEILTRQKIQELTGGLISAKTLANLDSEGKGITPRFRIGGKAAYSKDATIRFLKNRCKEF